MDSRCRRSKGSLPKRGQGGGGRGGCWELRQQWQRRRDARGCADAQLSRVVGRCNCTQTTPPMVDACIRFPSPPLFLARYVRSTSYSLSTASLSFFPRASLLPTFDYLSLAFSLFPASVSPSAVSPPLLPLLSATPPRLITPPFSLHPRSMTSKRAR